MTNKYSKDEVLKRLNGALKEAETRAKERHSDYLNDLKEYEAARRSWKQDYLAWVKGWLDKDKSPARYSGGPEEPHKPLEPEPVDAENIKKLISQIECIDGDTVSFSKDIIEGVGRYL